MQIGGVAVGIRLDMKGFNRGLDRAKSKLKSTMGDMKQVTQQAGNLGKNMTAGITAPVVGGLTAVTVGTRDFRTELGKLETNAKQYKVSMKTVNDSMRQMAAVTGETDSNVEGLSNLMASGFKGDQFKQMMNELAGASIRFKDTLKFEGVADGLQETLATGEAVGPFGELLERTGVNLDDFNAGLQEAIKNGTQQQYVLETLADKGLAKTYEQYKKNNPEIVKSKEANYDLQASLAKLGKTLEPVLTKGINLVTKLVKGFNNLSPTTKKVIGGMVGLAVVVGPLLVAASSLITAVTTIGGAFATVGPIIAGLTGPIGIAVGAVAGLIAIGVALWKNWDTVKEKILDIWNGIKEGIKGAVNAIIGVINGMIGGLNKVSYDTPDWLPPPLGGKEFGFNIPKIPKLAEGGTISRAGWALVGEEGPELLRMPRGAQVQPLNGDSTVINNYNVNIKNPVQEKAPDSTRRELLKLQYLGAF